MKGKKLLAIVLSAAMMLGTMPGMAFAQSTDGDGGEAPAAASEESSTGTTESEAEAAAEPEAVIEASDANEEEQTAEPAAESEEIEAEAAAQGSNENAVSNEEGNEGLSLASGSGEDDDCLELAAYSGDYSYDAYLEATDSDGQTTSKVMTDKTVKIDVYVEPASNSSVAGVQYILTYDSNKYSLDSHEFPNGSSLSYKASQADENGTKTIVVSGLLSEELGSTCTVGTFSFTAQAQDEDNVSTTFQLSSLSVVPTADSESDGEDPIAAGFTKGNTSTITLEYNDGLAQSLTYAGVTTTYSGVESSLSDVTVNGTDITVTYGTTSGTYDGSAATVKGTNAGTYTQYFKATKKGYDDFEDSYNLVINAKKVTVTWPNPVPPAGFTGSEINAPEATVTGLLEADANKWSYSGETKATNVGTYEVTLSFTAGNWQNNYSLPSGDALKCGWSIIVDNNVTNPTTITAATDWTYDGTDHALATISDTGVIGTNTITWHVNGVQSESGTAPNGKNAGTYSVSYVIGNTNYPDKGGSFTVNVSQKTVGLTWTVPSEMVYNGSEQGPTVTVTGLIEGDTCTATVSNGSQTNAGSYDAEVTELSNGNYTLPDLGTQQSYTIDKYMTAAVWDGYTKVYNGTAQTATATAAGINGETLTLSVSGSLTDVGTTTLTASISSVSGGQGEPANYELTSYSTNFDITAKPVSVTWANTSNLVYNGNEQKPTASTEDFISGEDVSLVVSGAQTNAGDNYTAEASLSGSKAGNYVIGSETSKSAFSIAKKQVTITAASISKLMGDTDPTLTGEVDGYLGNDQASANITYLRTAGESVGVYTISANYTALDNYAVTANTGTFTITEFSGQEVVIKNYTINKQLVLVFTTSAGVAFKYGDANMYKLESFGYALEDENKTGYNNVYGYIVDGTADASSVTCIAKSDSTPTVTKSGNVNGSSSSDANIADVAAINGVYNNKAGYSQETMLRSNYSSDDETTNGMVNATDWTALNNAILDSMLGN